MFFLIITSLALGIAEPHYSITVDQVREVCLNGPADLAYWQAYLEPHRLHPAINDGHAEVMICAYDSRWMGFAFKEVVFSVFTTTVEGSSSHDGAFILVAYNSRKSFARVEQRRNKSPYLHAKISATADGAHSSFSIHESGKQTFVAEMSGPKAAPTTIDTSWKGPIYLNGVASSTDLSPGWMFYVNLEGAAEVFSFSPSSDVVSMSEEVIPTGSSAALASHLINSHFIPSEWRIKTQGKHSKTDTLPRQ